MTRPRCQNDEPKRLRKRNPIANPAKAMNVMNAMALNISTMALMLISESRRPADAGSMKEEGERTTESRIGQPVNGQ